SHRTSSLEMRESIAFTRDELPQTLQTLRDVLGDVVIVSTCNRTEFYCTGVDSSVVQGNLRNFLAQRFPRREEELSPCLYFYEQEDAVRHLFRVASGLDSLILGESQILGQVREAYSAAVTHGCAGGVISRVFHHALRVGKRARHETGIGKNALSISSAAVEMARHTLGDITQRRVLVIGAGQAGKLLARALKDRGVHQMVMVNRTLKRAQDVAQELGGEATAFESLEELLETMDIVVSSTDSRNVVLTRGMVARARSRRNGAPLLIVDIAVPRDADPAIRTLPGVTLLDLDDLETVSQTNRLGRAKEAIQVEDIIDEEVTKFQRWWDSHRVAPGIAQLRDHVESLRRGELLRTLKQMPHLSEADITHIEVLSRAIVKKLLHHPIATIKEDPRYLETTQELFKLNGNKP
ncbi:MAG: glutamyl-tRNA reductase, partial [Dehalococcoidia bacterium]|nr:glutamyl-tRNA reductase [Dehalococcoidia bacterium]